RRATLDGLLQAMTADLPPNPNVSTEDRTIPGPDGDLLVRIYQPVNASGIKPGLLFIHGGGMVLGNLETDHPMAVILCENLDAVVVSVDYRLAPEHPFPAALDDAVAAYADLAARQRILIAGDSAGGGLALALACAARDAGLPPPAGIVVFSPWTDLANTGPSVVENADRCAMFSAAALHAAAAIYLAGTDPADPRASPLHADLTGLPPMLLFAGSDELMRDDTTRLAERARAAGGEVETSIIPGVPHVWPYFARWLPEGRDALALVRRFVARVAPLA
ncbi:MAG: alpha/beta hydrolase fold domain-containing protein, partial [Alphaproteobacteria bacterium]|nr:alpha/beta hydrolase fold domain-containing protein [Alphaproteobacteria bacterium]